MPHVDLRAPLALLILLSAPARAADLIEPFEPGLSDLELYATPVDEGSEMLGFLGLGLGRGFSLGLAVATDGLGQESIGGVVLYGHPVGAAADLDLWLEATVPSRSSGAPRALAAGAEWSRRLAAATAYVRLSYAREGAAESARPLLGVMLPVGARLELHAELAADWSRGTATPLRLALGPNLLLSESVELVPELALTRDPLSGAVTAQWSVGFVTSTRGLLDRLRGPAAVATPPRAGGG